MRPLTFSANKHFIPVANKPLIFYPIETVAEIGVKEIGITYNPGGLEEAQRILGDGSRWGLKFTYILQERPAGLADIIRVCEKFMNGEEFVFHLGDNIFVGGINEAVQYFRRRKPNGLITMVHHTENRRMGVPYFNKEGQLLRYVEKPENPPHDFAVPGVYFADSSIFRCFKEDAIKPSSRGELEIPDAFQWMIDHHLLVDVVEYKGKWLDPGKFNDWIEANQYLLDSQLAPQLESEMGPGTILENRVKVGHDCQIEGSHIRGPVIIGNRVVVKNSYIGPYTSVSDDCLIEDAHVENSVIMEGVKVSKIRQPIDTSLIGAQSEIVNSDRPTSSLQFFIGEKCSIEI